MNNLNNRVDGVNTAYTVPVQAILQQYGQPQTQVVTPNTQPIVTNNPVYVQDQASFSVPTYQPVPQPVIQYQPTQTSVGFFDRASTFLKDVYQSDQNIAAYNMFIQKMKANPGAYLQPGSNDKNRVLDLQQKLNFVGIKCNVNGEYGYATGEAVKEFKRAYNLSDGYLDKSGRPAVSEIATPEFFTVLSRAINNKLNPNSTQPANPYPVTQQELDWAQQLQYKIQKYGYKPSADEQRKYQDIFLRTQQQSVVGNTVVNPSIVTSVPQVTTTVVPTATNTSVVSQGVVLTQEEMDWALQLQQKIQNTQYKPTQMEIAKYNDIFNRYQMSGGRITQPQQVQTIQTPVTQQELDWAVQLQNKIETQGYQPTPQELATYIDIYNRYQQSQPVQNVQPTQNVQNGPQKVTQEELNWALQLQKKVESGYKATDAEIAQYTDIYNRYQSLGMVTTNQSENQNIQGSQNYIVLGNAIRAGTKAIWNNAPKDSTGVNGPTGNWEVDKHKLFYMGPRGEVIPFTELTQAQAQKLTSSWKLVYSPSGSKPGSINTQPVNNQPVFPENYPIVNQPVNNPTVNNQPPVNNYQPTNGVTQAELDWANQLYQRVQQGYKPTPQEIDQFNNIQIRLVSTPKPEPQTILNPVQPPQQSTGPITQEELTWAMSFQNQVQQGYKPTSQEIERYTDIYNRYQQYGVRGQQPVQSVINQPIVQPVTTGVTQAELDWANQLQIKVQQQGYQPTPQEIERYTDIYNRYQQLLQNNGNITQPVQNQTQYNNGNVTINIENPDPELQWALSLLDKFRQGYQPTDVEIALYEKIIAARQVPAVTP